MISHIRVLTILCLVLATLTGCKTMPRDRTLPPSIRSVYVPMVVNRTAEPSLEELATVAVQQELLADGRLDVVGEKSADAIVQIVLMDFQERGSSFDSNDFARDKILRLDSNVKIQRNQPGLPLVGIERIIVADARQTHDPRRITYETDAEARNELMQDFARAVVREVLTGELVPEP